jgi:hypothetical protein
VREFNKEHSGRKSVDSVSLVVPANYSMFSVLAPKLQRSGTSDGIQTDLEGMLKDLEVESDEI